MTSQFKIFSDDGSRDPQRRPAGAPMSSWPTAPGDPDAGALGEGWTALGQLVDKSGAARLDGAAAARLVREVERRVRRRRQVQWGAMAMAAAAVVLIALTFAWRPMFGGGAAERIVEKPAPARPLTAAVDTKPKASPTATPTAIAPAPVTPTTTVDTVRVDGIRVDSAVVDTAFDAPQYWHDPLDADLESARAYAGEVEHSWRRRTDRWAGLHDQMEQLQAELNESPL